MNAKLIAAASALVAATAVAALTGSTSAKPPRLTFNFECTPEFTKTEGVHSYTCSKNVVVMCKEGTTKGNLVLTHLGGSKWKISYDCSYPPA